MFILATTELQKVPATIRSRCQQFAFKRILPGDISARLLDVAGREGIDLTPEGAALLARLADGGLRDALSLLDQCVAPGRTVGETEVLSALGLAGNLETARLMEQIGTRNTADALETLGRLYGAGKDIGALLNELSSLSRDLLVRATAPKGGAALMTGGYDEAAMVRLSTLFSPQRLVELTALFQTTAAGLVRSANRRTDAELCLIRACDERLDASLLGVSARLARLEEGLASGNIASEAAPGKKGPAAVQAKAPQKSAAAPAAEEAPPPWEEVPSPEEPGDRLEQAPSTPDPTPAHVSVREEMPPSAPSGEFWPALAATLKGKVPMGAYTFLANPAMVMGRLEGKVLRLYAESDMVRGLINKTDVLETVRQAAVALLGSVDRAEVQVGKAPSAATSPGKRDALEDLLAFGSFDNIEIKE